MTETSSDIGQVIREILAKQTLLVQEFESAQAADSSLKDDISLGDKYKDETEFRMNKKSFLVMHIPSTLINKWSVFSGPMSLKENVEKWVDLLDQNIALLPKKD